MQSWVTGQSLRRLLAARSSLRVRQGACLPSAGAAPGQAVRTCSLGVAQTGVLSMRRRPRPRAATGTGAQLHCVSPDSPVLAGEACNTALNPCVQGAMSSAQKAALEMALVLQPPRPAAWAQQPSS